MESHGIRIDYQVHFIFTHTKLFGTGGTYIQNKHKNKR